MKIKNILTLGLIAIALTACNSKQDANDKVKQNGAPQATAVQTSEIHTFAYVDMDSLQSKYQFCIDASSTLESKMKAYQTAAGQKQANLQQTQQNIQKKMQDGSITTEEQYKAELEKYSRQEQAFAQYCQQQEQMLAAEQTKLLIEMQDSLDNYLEEFNKTKNFTLILNKAVILHAKGVVDVTNEIAEGLNKRYKKK